MCKCLRVPGPAVHEGQYLLSMSVCLCVCCEVKCFLLFCGTVCFVGFGYDADGLPLHSLNIFLFAVVAK